jgi:hypothetical protein
MNRMRNCGYLFVSVLTVSVACGDSAPASTTQSSAGSGSLAGNTTTAATFAHADLASLMNSGVSGKATFSGGGADKLIGSDIMTTKCDDKKPYVLAIHDGTCASIGDRWSANYNNVASCQSNGTGVGIVVVGPKDAGSAGWVIGGGDKTKDLLGHIAVLEQSDNQTVTFAACGVITQG